MDIDEMANAAMGFAMYDNFRKTMDNHSIAGDEGVPRPARNWFVILQGRQSGPFSMGEINSMISGGTVTSGSYVWKQGMADWLPASQIPELMPMFNDCHKEKEDESDNK